MSVKQIPVSEILETPDVNILNDNVLRNVNYSYNNTTMPEKPFLNFSYKGYIKESQNDTSIVISDVHLSPKYNSGIYDIAYEQIITKEYTSNGTEIPITNNFVKFKYDLDISNYLINIDTIDLKNANMSIVREVHLVMNGEDKGYNYDQVEIDFSKPINAVFADFTLLSVSTTKLSIEFRIFLNNNYIWNTGFVVTTVNNYLDTFTCDFVAETITTESIEIDNNSSFSLHSNELITQNTLYNGTTQISEYIAEDIKDNYENGKATIKLTCDYTGENEYSVGDIVVPMKDKDNAVLYNADGSEKIFEITSSEIAYSGRGTQVLELVEYNSTPKTWSRINGDILGDYIWTDGDNIYYSSDRQQYILDRQKSSKFNKIWLEKIWSGLSSFRGYNTWTDGDNIYYSSDNYHYILDRETDTWIAKIWSGLSSFEGANIWTDGYNIYYGGGNYHYILDRETDTWIAKIWNISFFWGRNVWTYNNQIFYSDGNIFYVLNKETGIWSETPTNMGFQGQFVWKDNKNLYISTNWIPSYSGSQYVLDKETGTWVEKIWNTTSNEKLKLNSADIWSDGGNIYYNSYVLLEEVYPISKVNCKTVTSLKT